MSVHMVPEKQPLSSEDSDPALRVQVARALIGKGISLGELDRNEEAFVTYEEVVRRFGEDPDPALRVVVAIALFSKGDIAPHDRYEEAIATYEEVVRRFGKDADPRIGSLVKTARFRAELIRGLLPS